VQPAISTALSELALESPDRKGSEMTAEVSKLIDELTRDRFFGSVELKFEAGRLVLVRKTETLKPCELDYRDTRGVGNGSGK